MSKRTARSKGLRATAVLAVAALALLQPVDGHAAFPGSNSRIAFHSSTFDGDEIFTMNPDGSDVSQLTDAPGSVFPDFSADGRKIAYTHGPHQDIWIMDADGTNHRPVTTFGHPAFAWMPSFSPDGSKIVFSSNVLEPINVDIYVIDVDGTDLTRLTTDQHQDQFPEFSPDGSKILFDRNTSPEDHDLFIMNADGTGETNLTPGDNVGKIAVGGDFSPDGTRIVFSASAPHLAEGEHDLYTADLTGGNVVRFPNEALHEESPAFSPDGSAIVYAAYDITDEQANCCGIYSVSSNGGNPTVLVQQGSSFPRSQSPDWGLIPVTFTRPGPPTNVQALPGSGIGEIFVSWDPPVTDGGTPVTQYVVYRSSEGESEQEVGRTAGEQTFTDTGLTIGTKYSYRIAAVNAVGQGLPSAPACNRPFPWLAALGCTI